MDFVVIGEEKIHCAGCESRIAFVLQRLPGVGPVLASAKTQHILVTIDPAQIGQVEVRAKLEHLGFRVEPVEGAI